MIRSPLLLENVPDASGRMNDILSRLEEKIELSPLVDFHAILIDPDSTLNQIQRAKRQMLEFLKNPDDSGYEPMLVPVLVVPGPREKKSRGQVRGSVSTSFFS